MTSEIDWRPSASLAQLQLRARVLARIRAFFAERNIMEVETPLLAEGGSTDPHLESFICRYRGPGAAEGRDLYLQTSPEFAMKRLLAAGSGPIFQIGKAFRNGEAGAHHNPEFTMLEWYRPGFDHLMLMTEVDTLVSVMLGTPAADRITYRELCQTQLGIDPHAVSVEQLRACVERHDIHTTNLSAGLDIDGWLALLFTHVLEPKLGQARPLFVYDYPPSQAMLAQVRPGSPPVAERFELYVKGMELANGFHELTDSIEQARRFAADLQRRNELGLPPVTVDRQLLAALAHGLPDCAGVALGIDRLLMCAAGVANLGATLAFPIK
ncbi:MAG: EF-P lysine aminoacylase GenX [Gammaproteobacteria bacterium]|nr:EF-P lysine aminoacylase GenX [Gammaproteobacteria bacterium]